MRILVTGAAGRLGKVVCRCLTAQGDDVVAVDGRYQPDLPVPLHVANLLDRTAIYPWIEGCQAVVHLANHSDMLFGFLPQTIYAENVTTDANVFQAAIDTGVRQIVFSSSIQTISGCRAGSEDLQKPSSLSYLPGDGAMPTKCGNLYALGKQTAENMLKFYASQQPTVSFTAIRFPWIIRNMERFRSPQFQTRSVGFLDEMFAILGSEDAAAFISAVLKANRPGYACCLPTAPHNRLGWSVPEVVQTFYPQVALRRPLHELKTLVDLDVLRTDYGWEPKQFMDLPRAQFDGIPTSKKES